ncbi:IDEAL domain-containing protein [Paraliobacillus sp. JSM ZJ581]|uniref:IDEAL domain-containing protein n=1 Tax=Paraliobacillus sp. JSM ZJ581 TaxID=3342118 RepID=UPI0035A8C873
MFSVNTFQPYYVKEEADRIGIVLAYQYFSLRLDGEVYQFVPLESRKIEISRQTLQVINRKAFFIFQQGKKFESIALVDLLQIPGFDQRLKAIVYPYVNVAVDQLFCDEVDQWIVMLEKQNMKRLIDQSLDEKDIEQFMIYSDQLNNM